MVGTDKYSDEQIMAILRCHEMGQEFPMIAAYCQSHWKNREFKANGVKYVCGKYKSIEEYTAAKANGRFPSSPSKSSTYSDRMPARGLNGAAVQNMQNWNDQAEYMQHHMGKQRAMMAAVMNSRGGWQPSVSPPTASYQFEGLQPKASPTASYQFDPSSGVASVVYEADMTYQQTAAADPSSISPALSFNEIAGSGYQPGMTYQQTAAGFDSFPNVPRNGGAGSGYQAGMSYQSTEASYQHSPYNGGAGGGHHRGMSFQATAAPSHAIPRSTAMAKQPTLSTRPTAIVRQPTLSNASAVPYNGGAGGVNQNGIFYQPNAPHNAAHPSMAMGQQPTLLRSPYQGGAVGGNKVGMRQAVVSQQDAALWAAFVALSPAEKQNFGFLGYSMFMKHQQPKNANNAYHAALGSTIPVQSPIKAGAPPSTPTGRLSMPPSTPSHPSPIALSPPMAPSKPTQLPLATMAPSTPSRQSPMASSTPMAPTKPTQFPVTMMAQSTPAQSVPAQLSTPASTTPRPSPAELITPSPSKRKADSPASEENDPKKAKTSAAAVVDDFENPSNLFSLKALTKHIAAEDKEWNEAALDAAGNQDSETDSLFDPAGLDDESAEEVQSPTAPFPIAAATPAQLPTPVSPKGDSPSPEEDASKIVEQSDAAGDEGSDTDSLFNPDFLEEDSDVNNLVSPDLLEEQPAEETQLPTTAGEEGSDTDSLFNPEPVQETQLITPAIYEADTGSYFNPDPSEEYMTADDLFTNPNYFGGENPFEETQLPTPASAIGRLAAPISPEHKADISGPEEKASKLIGPETLDPLEDAMYAEFAAIEAANSGAALDSVGNGLQTEEASKLIGPETVDPLEDAMYAESAAIEAANSGAALDGVGNGLQTEETDDNLYDDLPEVPDWMKDEYLMIDENCKFGGHGSQYNCDYY